MDYFLGCLKGVGALRLLARWFGRRVDERGNVAQSVSMVKAVLILYFLSRLVILVQLATVGSDVLERARTGVEDAELARLDESVYTVDTHFHITH